MSAPVASFRSAYLLERLQSFPPAKRYIVGFSGGADSTALLLALHLQRGNLLAKFDACHFNHGLHAESDKWQAHCESFCAARDIPLRCHRLNLSGDQSNLEETARDLRYQWVANDIDAETVYLTAHHADDRAETFLLNALRGSGLAGIASIPQVRKLGKGRVIRPLLECPGSSLRAYLGRHDVKWIEDPSNQDTGPDRNFIRNQVIPLLETRWPAAKWSLARTSAHLRNGYEALSQLLGQAGELCGFDDNRLPLKSLATQQPGLSGLMLREWLRKNEAPSVPESRLNEFLVQVSGATSQSKCELAWAGLVLRLYRNELYLSESPELPRCPRLKWNGRSRLELGLDLGSVEITGQAYHPVPDGWSIGPRRSGVRIRVHSGGPARKVKKVLQELQIPPWQRNSVPVLYDGKDALAIGDWQYAVKFGDWLEEHGLAYRWRPGLRELRSLQERCHNAMNGGQRA